MGFEGKIIKARILNITKRGKVTNLFIQWGELRNDEWHNTTYGLTVFSPEDMPDLNVRDRINVNRLNFEVNEPEEWKRGKVGETLTEDSAQVRFVNLTTFGDQIELVDKGDPTSKPKKVGKATRPNDHDLDDDLPF